MSESNRVMRITSVRRQEADLARQSSQAYKTMQAQKEEAQKRAEIQKKYFEKQALIAQLQEQRERAMSHLGEAHKQAEEVRAAQLAAEAEKKEKFEKFKQDAIFRGQTALQKEIEEKENRKYTENQLNVARQRMLTEETEQARQKASDFRFQKEIKDRERAEEEAAAYIPPSGLVITGPIDYTRTHFHNPVIVRHGLDADISGLEKAKQAEQDAYERMTKTAADQGLQEERRKQRGDKAINVELLKEEYKTLENELKQLHYADGEYKKLLGVYDPVCYNRTLAKDEHDRKVKESKMEQAYEDLFMEAPPQPIAQVVAQPAANVHTIPTAQPMDESSVLTNSSPEKMRIVLQEHSYEPVFAPEQHSLHEDSSVSQASPEKASELGESSLLKPNYSPEKSQPSIEEPIATSPEQPAVIPEEEEESSSDSSDTSELDEDVLKSSPEPTTLRSFDPRNYTELESYENDTEPKRYNFYNRTEPPMTQSYEYVKTSSSESDTSSAEEEDFTSKGFDSSAGPYVLTESELLESQPPRPMAAYESMAQETPNFAQKTVPSTLSDSAGTDFEFSLHKLAKANVIPEASGELSSSSSSESDDEDYQGEVGQSSVFDSEMSSSYGSSDIQITQKPFSLDIEPAKESIQEEYELSSSSSDSDSEQESEQRSEALDPISTSDLMDSSSNQREPTLAEAFAAKRKNMTEQFRNREREIKNSSEKKGRTKEEILALRKEMMKPKTVPVKKPVEDENPCMARLIKGEKPSVSKKEMKQLTKKNYHLLPEVLKKREEEQKKEEQRLRREKVKELERQRRSQRTSSKH